MLPNLEGGKVGGSTVLNLTAVIDSKVPQSFSFKLFALFMVAMLRIFEIKLNNESFYFQVGSLNDARSFCSKVQRLLSDPQAAFNGTSSAPASGKTESKGK